MYVVDDCNGLYRCFVAADDGPENDANNRLAPVLTFDRLVPATSPKRGARDSHAMLILREVRWRRERVREGEGEMVNDEEEVGRADGDGGAEVGMEEDDEEDEYVKSLPPFDPPLRPFQMYQLTPPMTTNNATAVPTICCRRRRSCCCWCNGVNGIAMVV